MSTMRFSHTALLTLAASMAASAQTPFVISNVHSALVLDLPAALATLDFTMIDQSTPSGGTNQQWTFHRPSGAQAYEILSVASGMAIDVPSPVSGMTLQQWPANGSSDQLWQITRQLGEAGYEIASVNQVEKSSPVCGTGTLCTATYVPLVLDVPGFSTAETMIQVYTENAGTNQQWNLQAVYPSLEAAVHLGHSISVSTGSAGATIDGSGFSANAEVCPVWESSPAFGVGFTTASCLTTSDLGTFTYTFPFPKRYTFAPPQTPLATTGYIVMTVEDKNQNLLAVGSVATTLYTSGPK